MLGDIFNRITTVAQDARVTIKVRDRARRATGVHVAFVERDVSGLFEKAGDVQAVFVFRSHHNRQFNLFPSKINLPADVGALAGFAVVVIRRLRSFVAENSSLTVLYRADN